MNSKINNYLIVFASLLIILPFNILINVSNYYINYIIYYVPAFAGYILFLTQWKFFNKKQKKILNTIICIIFISVLSFLWNKYLDYNDNWKTNTMSDMSAYIIPTFLFYASYFIQRILCIILAVKVLKKANN